MKIAILSDSSCSKNSYSEMKNFFYVPLLVTKPDGSQFLDDESLDDNLFYQTLDSLTLKTSLTPPGIMTEMWDTLLKEYDQVLVMLLSKGLSGQYNAARLSALEEQYANKVFVVDTNGVSIVLDEMIERANTLINDGENAENIKLAIEASNKDFVTFIIPKSLTQLVRGGRISKAAAGLAKILKITPILKYNGEIDRETKTRTFKKAVEEALEMLKSRVEGVEYVDIAYSRSDEATMKIVQDAVIKCGLKLRRWNILSNVITAHTGRHTFAFNVWKK